MARVYKSRFLKSVNGERNYKLTRYNRNDLRTGPSITEFTATPDEGVEPLSVDLEVTFLAATKWAGITAAKIDTGDSAVIDGALGDHDYENAGVYEATASVYDQVGRLLNDTVGITVT